MKIYKVCNDFLKGVQEFEITKINEDNTFTYTKKIGSIERVVCRDFITNISNDSFYFKTKKEAVDFMLKRIDKKINNLHIQLEKYEMFRNTIIE
jgi:hypothetical protein